MFLCELLKNDIFINIFSIVFFYLQYRHLSKSCNIDVRNHVFIRRMAEKLLLHVEELIGNVIVTLYK
jgi:hypothetical protein